MRSATRAAVAKFFVPVSRRPPGTTSTSSSRSSGVPVEPTTQCCSALRRWKSRRAGVGSALSRVWNAQ